MKSLLVLFLFSLSLSVFGANDIFWYKGGQPERVASDSTVLIDLVFVAISTYAWYLYIRNFDAKRKHNDLLFLIPFAVSLLMLYWREVVSLLIKWF